MHPLQYSVQHFQAFAAVPVGLEKYLTAKAVFVIIRFQEKTAYLLLNYHVSHNHG